MKYFRWYYNMLNKALLEKRNKCNGNYYEGHHIKPLCKGGKFIVLLTAREHFIAHLLLTKIYKNDMQLSSAFNKMFNVSENQDRYLPASYWYEYKRKNFSKNHPAKQDKVKNKISKTLRKKFLIKLNEKLNNEFFGLKFDFHICKNCNNVIYKSRANSFCSDKCSREYYKIQKKLNHIPKNKEETSKNLSEWHKNFIKETGRGNNMSKTSTIKIYDTNDKLMFESNKNNNGFIKMCQENNLPYKVFQRSYLKNIKLYESNKAKGKIPEEYKKYIGWYAIKN